MSDSAWVLRGVDPETRESAVEEARRLGVSLADYVTDVVLKTALSEQVGAITAAEPPSASAEPSDFGVRHRFRTLERRLESSVGNLDSAVSALDTALFDVASRVGEVEGLAGDTAHALQQALAEMAGQLAAVRLHIADVEENSVARDDETAAAQGSLTQSFTGLNYRSETIAQRVDDVETVARRADTNAAVLADAHEALKHAVAGDFSAFAQEISDRLGRGLHDVAAAADDAAAQADAAVAHLVVELRGVRESLEQSVADGVDETRRRIHAVFSEASQRIETLTERIDSVEVMSLRANEQLRIQLTDVEDAAQTSLEETAETLRQAGAALAADLQRSVQDGRAALESVHTDLAAEIADLRERQQGAAARLKQVDAAAANAANDLAALRETMLRRIADSETVAGEAVARVHDELGQELDTLASRFARHEGDVADTAFKLRAETERVEACTLAALEKLAGDIRRGDDALQTQTREDAARVTSQIGQLRARVDGEVADIREQQAGAAARLTVIDMALGAQTAQLNALAQTVAAQSDADLAQRIEDLRARLAAYENHASAAADGVNDLVRMLGRITTQNAETAAKADDRVHTLEVALADLKLDQLAARDKPAATPDDIAALQWRLSAVEQRKPSPAPEQVAAIEQRVGAIEAQQVQALEALRADIARFVADNDRRLAALESPEIDYNLAAEFDALRRRVEDRILGVEQRSVRTLEQVADTVQMLEQRFMGGPDHVRQTA